MAPSKYKVQPSQTKCCAAFLVVSLTIGTMGSTAKETEGLLRAQLSSQQREIGRTLAGFGYGVTVVNFSRRAVVLENLRPPAGKSQNGSLSPDGTRIAFEWRHNDRDHRLAISLRDGSDVQEFSDFANPGAFCWSPDNSKIAISAKYLKSSSTLDTGLYVLDVNTKAILQIDGTLAFPEPPCWSADGNQIVYQIADSSKSIAGTTIRIFDLIHRTLRTLGTGSHPTWSQDGKWISFLEGGSYFAVRPSGDERHVLFKAPHASTALWWSPDSLYVAYGVCCRSRRLDPDIYTRVFVRRISDEAQDWVADITTPPLLGFHWIQPQTKK